MGRMPRIQVEGAIYYLTPECSRNKMIFKDGKDYAAYIELLSRYRDKHDFKLFAFCLVPNSINLLIEPSDTATISQIMHDLIPGYTKYFNERYERTGRLFQNRYRIVLIEKEPNILKMTAYIHLIPKLMRLTGKMSGYKHTSLSAYLAGESKKNGAVKQGSVKGSKLDISREVSGVLGYLKDKSYQQFIDEMDPKEIKDIGEALKKKRVIGSVDFRKKIGEKVKGEKEAPEEPEAAGPADQPASIEKPDLLPQPVAVERLDILPHGETVQPPDPLPQPEVIQMPDTLPEPEAIQEPDLSSQSVIKEEPDILLKLADTPAADIPPQPATVDAPDADSQLVSVQMPKASGRSSSAVWIFAVAVCMVALSVVFSMFFAYKNIIQIKDNANKEIARKDTEFKNRLAKELDTASRDLNNSYEAKLASYQVVIGRLEAENKSAKEELSRTKLSLKLRRISPKRKKPINEGK